MMFINGNNYVVNNKRNFSPHKIADEELDRVADFAYEMCFGDGHHRAYRTGGDLIRHAGEKFCNTFQGKIAEVCMGHKTKRVKWNRPDDGESLLISAR